MQAREANLPGYTFTVFETSVESYFMVNPEPQPANKIQLPSQRLAVLLSVAGKPLSGLQLESLQELVQKKLVIYYFAGLEDSVQQSNEDRAREIAIRLQFTGLSVDIQGAGWPDLVQRATSGDFDLLLLPATANSRLPDSAVLLDNLARPESSAWVAALSLRSLHHQQPASPVFDQSTRQSFCRAGGFVDGPHRKCADL